MLAYYNEIDEYAAQWLRNLIAKGLIAPGDVDTRSIVDVRPDDLKGYSQCHFFAGIGGWSHALRLAGWPDERPVWTGSCPCQPFSAAGKGKAADDERHLAPAWLSLIAECRPGVIFGEQVEAAIGWGWLDFVFDALEAQGYACGAAVLPACGVGAPHIRQRLYFVADAMYAGRTEGRAVTRNRPAASSRGAGNLAHAERGTRQQHGPELAGAARDTEGASPERQRLRTESWHGGEPRIMADTNGGDAGTEGIQRSGQHGQQSENGRTLGGMERSPCEQVGFPGRSRISRRACDMGYTDDARLEGRGLPDIAPGGGA